MDGDSTFRTTITANVPPAYRPSRQRRPTTKAKGLTGGDADDDYEYDSGGPSTSGPATRAGRSSMKLKLGGGGGAHGDGGPGGEGPLGIGWDRELDSDPDEPLVLEEHLLLRVPPRLAPVMKDLVEKRDLPPDVWVKFKDSRRAVFHQGETLYGAKLVDLPTLLESQKMTGVGGQTVKVADISQMLLVEDEVQDESEVTAGRAFNIDDFVYPHGITPPLKHVRKRRFRKRLNKRTIEIVETAVEAMLNQDAIAQITNYELVDDVGSDDEYGTPGAGPTRGANDDLDSIGAPTPARLEEDDGDGLFGDNEGGANSNDDNASEEEDDDAFTRRLELELEEAFAQQQKDAEVPEERDNDDEEGSGSDKDGLFGSESGGSDDEDPVAATEEDPETVERKMKIKQLGAEVTNIEQAIAAKEAERNKAANPIFKKRFEDTIRKLSTERDHKKAQHAAAQRELEKKVEKDKAIEQAASEPPPAPTPAAGASLPLESAPVIASSGEAVGRPSLPAIAEARQDDVGMVDLGVDDDDAEMDLT